MNYFTSLKDIKNKKEWNFLIPLLLFVSIFLTTELSAQIPEYFYAPGTKTNSIPLGGGNTIPPKYGGDPDGKGKAQWLYAPDDFGSSVPTGMVITKIYFKAGNATYPKSTYTKFKVALGQSASTTALTKTWKTGLTTVKPAASFTMGPFNPDEWIEIELDIPFSYDPAEALIVETEQSATAGGVNLSVGSKNVGSSNPNYGHTQNYGFRGAASATNSIKRSYDFGFDLKLLIPESVSVVSIDSPAVFCSGFQDVYATIENDGTDQIDSVNVFWEVDGVPQGFINYQSLLDTKEGSGSSAAKIKLGLFDFKKASDIKVYVDMPNGVPNALSSDDTLVKRVTPALSGAYTVDANFIESATNFVSLLSLTDAINTAGVCGPTTIKVASGNYPNDPIYLGDIPGTSEINNVVIDGGSSSKVIVTGDGVANFATLTFDGTHNVHVKNMTFKMTGTSGNAVFFVNTKHDTLSNCYTWVDPSSTSKTLQNISFPDDIQSNSKGGSANYNVVQNNQIIGGYYGINAEGSTTELSSYNQFYNNEIDSTYQYGASFYYQDSLEFVGNSINALSSTLSAANGIRIHNANNTRFAQNYVWAKNYATFFQNYKSQNKAPIHRRNEVSNNMLYSKAGYGLRMENVISADIWHNSVNVEGALHAVELKGSATEPISKYDVRNNIFTADKGYALKANAPGTIFEKLDYNIYKTFNGAYLLNIDGKDHKDLGDYIANQSAFNNNSIESDPIFSSLTGPVPDLHIIGSIASEVGDISVGIKVDIDGDVRLSPGTNTVDIGADEYIPQDCSPSANLKAANISLTSADIYWASSNPEATFLYMIVPCGSDTSLVTPVSATSDSLTIDGLQTGTCYEFYVRDVCGRVGSSLWSGPQSFYTAFGVPFFEDFQTFSDEITGNPWPKGWSSTTSTFPRWESNKGRTGINNYTGPEVDHTYGNALGIYVFFRTTPGLGKEGNLADFVSPAIFVDSSQAAVRLSYWYHFYGATIGGMDVIVDTNGVENVVLSYTGQQQASSSEPWLQDSIDLAGYEGKLITLKFRGERGTANTGHIAIDDVKIDAIPPIDGTIIGLNQPVESNTHCYTSAEDVNIELFNNGYKPLDFTVNSAEITVDVSGAITQTLTLMVNDNSHNGGVPLGAGQSMSIPLGTIDMSSVGNYYFDARVNIAADTISGNDIYLDTIAILRSGGTLALNRDSTCSGEPITLLVEDYFGSIQWQEYDSVSSSWQDVAGATTEFIAVNPQITTNYRVLACGSFASDTLTLNVVSLQAPVVVSSGSTVINCGSPGVDTLIATSTVQGVSFSWYDSNVGGNLLQEGGTMLFTGIPSNGTPAIDTFYVSTTIGGEKDTVISAPHASNSLTVGAGRFARGYHFVAPMDFTITGLEVAIEAGTGDQNIAVLRTNNQVSWNNYSSSPTPFTTMYLAQNSSVNGYIPVNISVKAGDVIGILGQRGTGTSYGTARSLKINGIDVPSGRFIMQNQLGTTTPENAVQLGYASEGMARINFTYTITDACESERTMVVAGVECIPYYPIGTINASDATGIADSVDVTAWTSGTVVGVDLNAGNGLGFTIIDMSSGSQEGIYVHSDNVVNGYSVTEGDSIRVLGTVKQSNGLTQMVVDSIKVIPSGNAIPTPRSVTTLDESTESQYLEMERFILLDASGIGSYNMRAYNGVDTITINIDAQTDVSDSLAVITKSLYEKDTICLLLGVGGQNDPTSPYTGNYQIMPMQYSDLTICKFVDPYYPIGSINTSDANGVADSTDVTAWTSGTVVGVDLNASNGLGFTIIDMSSGSQEGIFIHSNSAVSNYSVTEGDSIKVLGTVGQSNGLTQVIVDSIKVIPSDNAIPAPRAVSTLNESTESQYLEIQKFVLLDSSRTGSYSMRAYNGTDTIVINIDAQTEVSNSLEEIANSLIARDTICLMLGVGGQYDTSSTAPYLSGYHITPMRFSDLTICKDITIGISDKVESTDNLSFYPNPTTGSFTMATNGLENDNAIIIIRDISGKVIVRENIINSSSPFKKHYSLEGEAKGLYLISIIDGEKHINKKLILQ